MNDKQIIKCQVRIDAGLWQKIRDAATAEHRKINNLVVHILAEWINERNERIAKQEARRSDPTDPMAQFGEWAAERGYDLDDPAQRAEAIKELEKEAGKK